MVEQNGKDTDPLAELVVSQMTSPERLGELKPHWKIVSNQA